MTHAQKRLRGFQNSNCSGSESQLEEVSAAMPLVRRKRPLEADREDLETNCCKRIKSGNKVLHEFDKIGYTQDFYHSLHRSLPSKEVELQKLLSVEIGSFLNGKGGILCFGCRQNGTIYGDWVNRKEEDNIKLIIDTVFKRFRPMVEPQNYRVTFTPVCGWRSRDAGDTGRVLLELRIRPGDPFEMYEDCDHEVYLRKNDKPFGPLTPHEIKRLTTQQLWKKLKATASLQKLLEPPKESAMPDKSLVAGGKKVQKSAKADSSGSDEDPISVAIVRPMVSVVTKSVERENSVGEKVSGKVADSAPPTSQAASLNQRKSLAPVAAKATTSIPSSSSTVTSTKPPSSSSSSSFAASATTSSSLTRSTVNTTKSKPISATKPIPSSQPHQSTQNSLPCSSQGHPRKIHLPVRTTSQHFTVSHGHTLRHPLERATQAKFPPPPPPPQPFPPPPQMLPRNFHSFTRPEHFHSSYHPNDWYRY